LIYIKSMEKVYSEIIGLPVTVEGVGKIARITDILVDTNDGRVVAFFVNAGKTKIVAPIDIIFFGRGLVIHSAEDIIDTQDLIKATKVIESDIKLLKNRVETKKGEYLGNVYDFYIDTGAFGLTKIVVHHKSFMGFFKTPDRLIPARDIIEIKKGLVIVKNKYSIKRAEEKKKQYSKLYPDMAS
jgi:sporulation protein YlmC with PRC-barrel domain